MNPLYTFTVSIHVLAAIAWLGGMFFFALVGAPVLREIESPALRAQVFGALGRRFRLMGWGLIGILLLTGVANLHFLGLLDGSVLGSASFWSSRVGRTLMWKLVAVGAMLVFSASHDFVFGPAASRLQAGSIEARRARHRASWLARLNALAGLAIVLAAVRLARGG